MRMFSWFYLLLLLAAVVVPVSSARPAAAGALFAQIRAGLSLRAHRPPRRQITTEADVRVVMEGRGLREEEEERGDEAERRRGAHSGPNFLNLRKKYHRHHCPHRRCLPLHSRVPFP